MVVSPCLILFVDHIIMSSCSNISHKNWLVNMADCPLPVHFIFYTAIHTESEMNMEAQTPKAGFSLWMESYQGAREGNEGNKCVVLIDYWLSHDADNRRIRMMNAVQYTGTIPQPEISDLNAIFCVSVLVQNKTLIHTIHRFTIHHNQ